MCSHVLELLILITIQLYETSVYYEKESLHLQGDPNKIITSN